ncbi:MAG: DUF6049 family protein [Ornithinimicrobium sp.]
MLLQLTTVTSLLLAPFAAAPASALTGQAPQPAVTTSTVVAQASPQVDILIDEVEPAVLGPDRAWELRGSVRNIGTVSIELADVEMRTGWVALDTSAALDAWSSGEDDVRTPRLLAEDPVDEVLVPGEELDFALPVEADTLSPPFSFTTLPLRVDVSTTDGSSLGSVRSVLPWYSGGDAATPLGVSWVVPLTVPGDATLTSSPAPERNQAWLDTVGDDSPARAWLDGLSEDSATFVVDPALLAPLGPAVDVSATPTEPPIPLPEPTDPDQESPTPEETGSADDASNSDDAARGSSSTQDGPAEQESSDTATPTPSQPDLPELELPDEASVVQRAEAELQVRLGELDRSQLWWLPLSDPDVAALIDTGTDPELTRRLLRGELSPTVFGAERLLERGQHGASWPAFDVVNKQRLATLREVWPEAPPLATILPRSAFNEPAELVGQPAGDLSSPSGGMPVLGYDERLASILGEVQGSEQDGASVQLLLAHSLARYQRQPSMPGTVVLSPPRDTAIEAETVDSLTEALDQAPWIEQVSASDLMDDPVPVRLTGTPPAVPPADTPMSLAGVTQIETVRATLTDLSEIIQQGGATEQWDQVLDGLYSTRWRGRANEWVVPLSEMEDQVTTITGGVRINPTEVNFLAQEGLIQLTVVNELPVTVQDLQLGLEPGNGRLRIIEAPEAITIGPGSRATVQFRAEAIAAGDVPVRATLSTPRGLTIGEPEDLGVQVRPTGIWIYWVLGGLAGVILILGLARAMRRPTRPSATTQALS